jgi:hypothetical protein
MSKNITLPDYSLFSIESFFGGTKDISRLIIIIYIFLSFILNILNFIIIGIKQNRKRQMSIVIIITCSFLLINFIHTAAYLFEWVLKDDDIIQELKDENGELIDKVGGLLIGNPSNFFPCYAQAFILISSSISQDFIVNIFFYMINLAEEKLRNYSLKLCLLLLILGFAFPIGFTLVYFFSGVLGITDKFCYVKKFNFQIINNRVDYTFFEYFQIWVMIIDGIRVIIFFLTLILLIIFIKYAKNENKSNLYIFKSIIIPIIQLFTIFIGVIYRLLNLSNSIKSEGIFWLYLVLNISDGVLFPLIFLVQYNIFGNLKSFYSEDRIEVSESDSNPIFEDNISDYNKNDDD